MHRHSSRRWARFPSAVVIASHDRWLRRLWSGERLELDAGHPRGSRPLWWLSLPEEPRSRPCSHDIGRFAGREESADLRPARRPDVLQRAPVRYRGAPSHRGSPRHPLARCSNMCSNECMRWSGQELGIEQADTLPGLAKLNNLVRSGQTPDFSRRDGPRRLLAKSALNKGSRASGRCRSGEQSNPYRGCF